jgi:NAD(P)-dependent dehydrogenase (short-subunit alcohol dehydrogenase family)
MSSPEFTQSTALLKGKTALVTGASRGFGRAIAAALWSHGASVIGVARNGEQLESLGLELGEGFLGVVGNVCDAEVASTMIRQYCPEILVLNAGATPIALPLQDQTWTSFSQNWNVDTQHVFNWTKEALRLPLAPGSVVIALSSGAAIMGSPLSGGYAGAKATIRFISQYAAGESKREDLAIRFVALLPQITSATDLGAAGAAAYAEREGVDLKTFLSRFEPLLTPKVVGESVATLCEIDEGDREIALAYMLSGEGVREIP